MFFAPPEACVAQSLEAKGGAIMFFAPPEAGVSRSLKGKQMNQEHR